MKKQKPRLLKTLKCSKSKTIRHRKIKSSHHVELITSTWCELSSFLGLIVLNLEHFKVLGGLVFVVVHPLYFNYAPLSQKLFYALCLSQNLNLLTFCRPESFARKSLPSGKFSTFMPLDPANYETILWFCIARKYFIIVFDNSFFCGFL